MNQSTNYNFNLPEGTDLVNLLTQLIPNWTSLDTLLKGVEDQAFTNCTEVVSLGVHAITRSNADGKILKWIASANYTAGDTFTVDGNLISASTASGESLATNAIVSGAVIIAALNADESAMTIFVTGTNIASDSQKLGGELPSYYATASDMSDAQSDITDLDNLMGSTSISAIGDGTVTGSISDIHNDLPVLETGNITPVSVATGVTPSVNYRNYGNVKEVAFSLTLGATIAANVDLIVIPTDELPLGNLNIPLMDINSGNIYYISLNGVTGAVNARQAMPPSTFIGTGTFIHL